MESAWQEPGAAGEKSRESQQPRLLLPCGSQLNLAPHSSPGPMTFSNVGSMSASLAQREASVVEPPYNMLTLQIHYCSCHIKIRHIYI